MEKDKLARPPPYRYSSLQQVRFPPQPQHRPSVGADAKPQPPLHRYLPPSPLGCLRFYVLVQNLAHLAEEVESSKSLDFRLHWLLSLLGRDQRLLQDEAPILNANPSNRLYPRRRRPLSRSVWVRFALSVDS